MQASYCTVWVYPNQSRLSSLEEKARSREEILPTKNPHTDATENEVPYLVIEEYTIRTVRADHRGFKLSILWPQGASKSSNTIVVGREIAAYKVENVQ